MSYAFSFTRQQWWSAVAGMVALLALMFGAGFVGGALWQRSRAEARPPEHSQPPAPTPAPAPPTAPSGDLQTPRR